MGRLELPIADYIGDTKSALDNSVRVLQVFMRNPLSQPLTTQQVFGVQGGRIVSQVPVAPMCTYQRPEKFLAVPLQCMSSLSSSQPFALPASKGKATLSEQGRCGKVHKLPCAGNLRPGSGRQLAGHHASHHAPHPGPHAGMQTISSPTILLHATFPQGIMHCSGIADVSPLCIACLSFWWAGSLHIKQS